MDTADGPVRFRIAAAAAASWATVLLESEAGALFVHTVATSQLELIGRDTADGMIACRA